MVKMALLQIKKYKPYYGILLKTQANKNTPKAFFVVDKNEKKISISY